MASFSSALPIAAGLAVASGVFVAMQPVVNGLLAQRIGSPLLAATMSFGSGTLALLSLVAVVRPPWPSGAIWASVPPFLWVAGGLFGAFFVTAAAWSAPRVGVGVYLAVLVTSQLIAAMLADHFGLTGSVHPITLARVLGTLLLIGGCILVVRG